VTVDGQSGSDTWAAIHLALLEEDACIKKARVSKKGRLLTSLVGEGKPAILAVRKISDAASVVCGPFARALIEKV